MFLAHKIRKKELKKCENPDKEHDNFPDLQSQALFSFP